MENEKRLKALKAYLIREGHATLEKLKPLTVKDTLNGCYDIFDLFYDTFEIIGNTYIVLTKKQAYNAAKEAIINRLWQLDAYLILRNTDFFDTATRVEDNAFVSALSNLQAKIGEEANIIIKALISDLDSIAVDAIYKYGRGYFISQYDGKEHEQDEFFIYRIS